MAIISRRDLLRFAGGASVGTLLSPLPWKVLDDVSIWTQNWSWIPKPPKGAASFKYTNCALCSSGCAAKVRCIEGQPVSLAGVRSGETGTGSLCPLGLVAHHLRYQPGRVTQPLVRATGGDLEPSKIEDVTAIISAKLKQLAGQTEPAGRYLAVLGGRPGTAASNCLQTVLSHFPRAAFITTPGDADGLQVLGGMVEGEATWALDIANARTVLNFGAPLLEGWGTRSRMLAQFAGLDRKTKLIHAEPNCSLTARSADVWLAIHPGSEAALALGLANILLSDGLVQPDRKCPDLEADGAYRKLLAEFSLAEVARSTGLQPDAITRTARTIAQEGPSLVVSRGHVTGPVSRAEEMAIQGLNLLLGNLDKPGGVLAVPVTRENQPNGSPARPQPGSALVRNLDAIPDGSLELLIVDASLGSGPLPWSAVQPKLRNGESVVAVLAGGPAAWIEHADIVVPSPVFGEAIEEVPRSVDDPSDSLRLSARLVEPESGRFQLLGLVNRAVQSAGLQIPSASPDEAIKQKVARIHGSGVGTVFSPANGESKAVAEFASADELWTALTEGGCWQGEPSQPAKPAVRQFSLAGREATDLERIRTTASHRAGLEDGKQSEYPLAVLRAEGLVYDSKTSPLLAKITWESGLHAERQCVMNPSTAAAQGVVAGHTVSLRTPSGSARIPCALSEEIMPGVILLANPEADDSGLMAGADGICRVMPGRLEEA